MNRRFLAVVPLLAGSAWLAGCDDITVPDFNNPSLEQLTENPTATGVRNATSGLVIGSRLDQGTYLLQTSIVGREAYFLDPNEGRYASELLAGKPDPGSFTGGSTFANRYRNIRNAYVVLEAVDKVTGLSDTQKNAIRGFAKTFQALDFLYLLNTRERIPIDVNRPLSEGPAPLATREEAFARVIQLLDEGAQALQQGGTGLPFSVPQGFTQFGFNTPARILQFNRALRARTNAYRGQYQQVLTDLQGSFLTTAGAVSPSNRALLNQGVYFSHSTTANDLPLTNLSDLGTRFYANPQLRTEAQRQASGERDARFVLKTDSSATVTRTNVSSNLRIALYTTRPFFGSGGQSSPAPIIRNEELILLRSEARWFTGDRAGALADLNFIRQNSGGLAPLAQPATDQQFVDALLYERTYSLLLEGHRYVDLRRFNRLAQFNNTPRQGDVIPAYFPLPTNECLARGLNGNCGGGF